MLTRRKLLRMVDTPAIEAAIGRAEARTSAEIRVSLAPLFWGSVRAAAERAFARLGMRSTRGHNGVLIFVVPARRSFAVVGDVNVDTGCWTGACELLAAAFRDGRYTEGLVAAISFLGEHLARDSPADPTRNPDELPNTVVTAGARGVL